MDTRPLGRTGLDVSPMGLGLAALGRPGYINLGHADDLERDYDAGAMMAKSHAVLDAAWTAGIRYLDVARSYGRAEEFLARWLNAREGRPPDVTVGSKWGYTYTAGWRTVATHHEIKDHSLEVLSRQIAESRALLGSHLDLYQIHSATLDSGVLENRAVLEALAHLRADRLVIGLSLTGPRQADTLRTAMGVAIDGVRLFQCVQATWNVLEPSAGAALAEAHDAGIGVIIKEGLANGRLTSRNADPAFATQRQRQERIAGRLGTTMDALALAAVLAQPWADVVLSGAATVAHLHSNLAALGVRWDEQAASELSSLAEDPKAYWATRGTLAWN